MVQQFTSLEHQLYRQIKDSGLQKFILAVSGGLDSMALLSSMHVISGPRKINIKVGHIHHGLCDDPVQLDYRDRCWKHLSRWCENNRIPFLSNLKGFTGGKHVWVDGRGPESLKSESDFRDLRYLYFNEWLGQWESSSLVTAHHQQDLLETRLLRLIRGTGLRGLKAMEFRSGQIFRPLLENSRQELQTQVEKRAFSFFEDPSNQKSTYERNWLRNEWLPQLEAHRPGALKSLGRSLELIVEQENLGGEDLPVDVQSGLERSQFLGWTSAEKKQRVANYLQRLGVRTFSSGQLNELVKRLASTQKEYSFEYLGLKWVISTRHISGRPSRGLD